MAWAPIIRRWGGRALKVGSTAGKIAFGGAGSRAAAGALIGGIYGGMTSDSGTPEGVMASILRGATAGGALGAATRLVTPALNFRNGTVSMSAPWISARTGMRAGEAAFRGAGHLGNAGWNALEFTVKHPYMVMGAGAGVGGAVLLNNTMVASRSPTMRDIESRTTGDQQEQALANMSVGISPMGSFATGSGLRRQNFINSTNGLVQGLHRGRH